MVEIKNVQTFFPKYFQEESKSLDDFLKNITVYFDIKGNGVFMPEFQRYSKTSNTDIIMSQGTMHSLEKFMANEADNDPFTKYITKETKQQMRELYQNWVLRKEDLAKYCKEQQSKNETLDPVILTQLKVKNYVAFETLVHNLPRGFELWATVVSNYFRLKTMVVQRFGHKNQEDWGNFVAFCYDLPGFRKLCNFESPEWDLKEGFPLAFPGSIN